jgi:glycogen synthase
MRIGIVTTEYPPIGTPGGIGTYCRTFAEALAGRGHQVHVMVPGARRDVLNGVHLHPLSSDPSDGALTYFGYDYARSCTWASEVAAVARDERLDIIESQDYLGPMFGYLYEQLIARDACRVPVVVVTHGPSWDVDAANALPSLTVPSYMREFVEAGALRMADAVISPSRYLGRRVIQHLGLAEGALQVEPYPLNDPGMRRTSFPAPEILFVGRLERRKGIESLATALHDVLRERPDATCRFVGDDRHDLARGRGMLEWLRAYLHPFTPRLQFDGHLDRSAVIEAFSRASVVAVPSLWENYPNVCMEAMATGAVVVASDAGGMAEMIEEGRSGFIVPAGDPKALGRAMLDALRLTGQQRRAIGDAARARILALCDPDTIVERRLAHFARVIEGARTRTIEYPGWLRPPVAHPRRAVHRPERVAVVVPCYNMASTLPATIESILASTLPPHEVIVVDDGSSDERMPQVLAALPSAVKVVRTPNQGLSAARNTGAAACTADAVVFLDADDLIAPSYLETGLDLLRRYPEVGFVTPWVRYFEGAEGAFCPPVPHLPLLLNRNMAVCAAMVRMDAYRDAGGFSPRMRFGYEDWQFWIAVMAAGWGALAIPRLLHHYRIRPHSMMRQMNHTSEAHLREQMMELTPEVFRTHAGAIIGLAQSERDASLALAVDHTNAALRAELRRAAVRLDTARALLPRVLASGLEEVTIYGAGEVGAALAENLAWHGIRVLRFVDRSPEKLHTRLHDADVVSLEEAIRLGSHAFVVGSFAYADEIRATIEAAHSVTGQRPLIIGAGPYRTIPPVVAGVLG